MAPASVPASVATPVRPPSGIQAAIVELRAQIDRYQGLVSQLEAVEHSIHASYPPAPSTATSVPSVGMPTAERQPSSTATAAAVVAKPKAAPSAVKRPQQPGQNDRDIQVLALIRKHAPVSARELIAYSGLKRSHLASSLKRLASAGRAAVSGSTTAARWRLLTPKNGQPVKAAASSLDGSNVVWNGSMERAGKAPSLLGDRSQKAAS